LNLPGLTFASLFCDAKTTEAFTQLFTELFNTIAQVTGKLLKLAPFFPDAKCCIVMLDGEVPQALALGNFPVGYNDSEVSGINSWYPIQLLGYCLKTCSIHFRSQLHDNAKAAELLQIEQKGVMQKRWNGVGEHEKFSAHIIVRM
jgi:hypothetical protein